MIKKTVLSLKHIQFFSACIFLLIILIHQAYPIKTTAGVVVLPFTIDSSFQEIRNDFSDNLIQKLKNAGFNAIGTRYLSSVLKMDDCSSDECMKRIASIVGARYVISGSFAGDSSSLKLSFTLKDLMENKQLISLERVLNGGSKAPVLFTDELSALVSQSLGDTEQLPIPPSLSSVSQPIDTSYSLPELVADVKQSVEEPKGNSAEIVNDTAINQSDSMNQTGSSLAISDTVVTANSADKKDIAAESIRNITSTENIAALNSDTIVRTEQSIPITRPERISTTDFKSSTPVKTVIAPDYPGIQTPRASERPHLVKPLPGHLSQQHFRGARLLLFGNTAIVGFIGGIIMNEQVKKSLVSENNLYNIHRKADDKYIESTYDSYIRQTEKTDRDSRYRNILYAVSGASALCFSISIFF